MNNKIHVCKTATHEDEITPKPLLANNTAFLHHHRLYGYRSYEHQNMVHFRPAGRMVSIKQQITHELQYSFKYLGYLVQN